MIALWLGCRTPAPPPPVSEPLPTAYHEAARAEADERVPDPARGGPPLHPSSSPLPPFTGVDRSSATYVGSDTCRGCHVAASASWSASAHSHAREVLAERRNDPGCLQCHTTGLGHPGGFSGGERLQHVGCEACHGPASDHVAAPAAGYGELPRSPAACVACHTHDQSPDFRWELAWPAIAHASTPG